MTHAAVFCNVSLCQDRFAFSIQTLGIMNGSDSIPWCEVFPDIMDEEGPGVVLRAMRRRECPDDDFIHQAFQLTNG